MRFVGHQAAVVAVVLVVLVASMSCTSPSAASPVERNLRALLDGSRPLSDLAVTYTDLHALHGGLRMTISGSGEVDQEAVRTAVKPAHAVNQENLRQLIRLLIEQRAWEQRAPERAPVPDESRAYLRIRVGDAASEIWEWFNDLKTNDRLNRILVAMQDYAWG